MALANADLLLTALFLIGFFQWSWLSVFLLRKEIAPSKIRLSLSLLLGIWVLLWPAYQNTLMPLLSLGAILVPLLLLLKPSSFSRHFALVWHRPKNQSSTLPPWLMLFFSFVVVATLFHLAPELGFGAGLSICLVWFAADWVDAILFESAWANRFKVSSPLGFRAHPKQTLLGHFVILLGVSLFCTWSLQLYHQTGWQLFVVAATITALITSICRAIFPEGWNFPLATLGMSLTLWLL